MDKTKYFVNFVISLLESCGLFALKHQAGSRARLGDNMNIVTTLGGHMLLLRPEVWRSVIVFFYFWQHFYLGVIQVATILSSSRLNLHVQYCILCP